ncbi:MAG: hypothetical protein QXI58_00690 [Candidatus Micrarchaeia archaeon]
MRKHFEVEVDDLPLCNFCKKTAEYDARTIYGPWAYMCEDCFKKFGIGLGIGQGQKLIKRRNNGKKVNM